MKIFGFKVFAATVAAIFGFSNASIVAQTSSYQYLISDQQDAAAATQDADATVKPQVDASATADANVAVDNSADIEIGDNSANQITFGGWLQQGYHTYNNGMFNTRNHKFNLHQAYIYAEKKAVADEGLGLGFRMDYVYGVDGPNTQAFGGPPTSWDNSWDRGATYGHAIPQLYGEVAMGDVSVKVGHFYTIMGYEVVTAPDNFFYSHAFTMNMSEPFTHTGVLATLDMGDVTAYHGYTLGWDSGFDTAVPDGGNYLGGASLSFGDAGSVTATSTYGRLGGGVGNLGQSHSLVLDLNITDRMNFVMQSDYVYNFMVNESYGVNTYLFYDLTDDLSWGTRMEWWNTHVTGAATGSSDLYNITSGLNIKLADNFIVRPEIRWDNDKDGILIAANNNHRIGFGMDWILTY